MSRRSPFFFFVSTQLTSSSSFQLTHSEWPRKSPNSLPSLLSEPSISSTVRLLLCRARSTRRSLSLYHQPVLCPFFRRPRSHHPGIFGLHVALELGHASIPRFPSNRRLLRNQEEGRVRVSGSETSEERTVEALKGPPLNFEYFFALFA